MVSNAIITVKERISAYQPAQAINRSPPISDLPLAKVYNNVYIMTVGSATPKINRGCPPKIAWIIPQMAVEASVSTVLNLPSTYYKKFVQTY